MRKRLFASTILLFFAHQLLQWGLEVRIPFLDGYLDPFLAMPVLLFLLDEETAYFRKRPQLVLPEILASFLIFSLLFEWLFPFLSEDFTRDLWDVLAYFIGTVMYLLARQYDESSPLG